MEVRLQKWGNSAGIRIPSSVLKSLNIKINDILKIETHDEKMIISLSKNNKISLYERFKNYKGDNLAKDFSWDSARGKELW